MKYQATVGFEGVLSMNEDEIRELNSDELIVKDLLAAGFIKPVKVKAEDKGDE